MAFALFASATILAATPASRPSTQPALPLRATYLDDVRAQLDLKWPKNRIVNIVCHGHSVPAGYFRTPEVRSLDAYPNVLRQRLAAAFPHAVINVIVTAVGGENSESGAERFARDVLSLHPAVVTIDYGLNDRAIGLERAEKAWTAMINQAKAAGVKVILLTPTGDLTADLTNPKDPLNQHADQIRELARRYGVGLVDSLELFKRYVARSGELKDLMAQSNHPNSKGHALVGGALAQWFTTRAP
jgi:lysophospholipase L1-like esterase